MRVESIMTADQTMTRMLICSSQDNIITCRPLTRTEGSRNNPNVNSCGYLHCQDELGGRSNLFPLISSLILVLLFPNERSSSSQLVFQSPGRNFHIVYIIPSSVIFISSLTQISAFINLYILLGIDTLLAKLLLIISSCAHILGI